MGGSKRLSAVLFLAGIVLGSASCGAMKSMSPTSPSETTAMQSVPSRGATIQGTVTGGAFSSRGISALTSSMVVKVVGTSISAPVSVSGTFVLEGVPSGAVRLEFSSDGGPVVANVGNVATGDRLDLEIRIRDSAGVIESSIHIKADNSTAVKGKVKSISNGCPNATIVVNGWTLRLDGVSQSVCSSIKVGVKVKIKGTLNAQKIIIVARVEISGHDDDEDSDSDTDSDSDSDRRRLLLRRLRGMIGAS